jgi:hypothetical protein
MVYNNSWYSQGHFRTLNIHIYILVKKQMEVDRVSAITNAKYKKQKMTQFAESGNEKKLWTQHFGVSVFGISGFIKTRRTKKMK